MRITRLLLDDDQRAELIESSAAATGLNVLSLSNAPRGTQLTELLGSLLYGRSRTAWIAGPFARASGAVDVEDPAGAYRLRRRIERDGDQKLTIASLDGKTVPSRIIETLHQGLPLKVTESVFHANGRRGDQLSELLSEDVAHAFQHLGAATDRAPSRHPSPVRPHADLLDYRDELARAVEHALKERRIRSVDVEREIQEMDGEIERLATRREDADRERMAAESRLAAIESQLRFRAINETIHRETDRADLSAAEPQLADLDEQIGRWRDTLADLELRESSVRSQLATIHPDDASPSITLADQRAGLAVASRLLEDLEGEVARLARAADSRACVCQDAHPRINPLVETLNQQIMRLSDLADQQQHAFEAQNLKAEAEHLARSQADMQRQLDHLLTRRQEVYRATRTKRDDHRRGAATIGLEESETSREVLQAELALLHSALQEISDSLARLQSKRGALRQERSDLLASPELDSLQADLADVQRRLREQPVASAATPDIDRSNPWRASDLFARLTDGQWVSLRLVNGGRELAATDRLGQQRLARDLPSSERRLAALSLRLSMTWAAGEHRIELPLLLDEPFAGLDAPEVSRLATLLDDYGRTGRQVVVSTDDTAALDRFRSLGASFLSPRTQPPREFEVETVVERAEPARRVAVTSKSEYLLSPDDRIERFPVPIRNREAVFSRSRIRTIADLLGADPSAVAEELDRDDVTAELVALWQTHLALVCFVPHMTFDDAVALSGAGVYSVDELADHDGERLVAAVLAFLNTSGGERLRMRGYRFDSALAERIVRDARQGRSRWSSSPAWQGWQRHRGERRQRAAHPYTTGTGSLRLRRDTAANSSQIERRTQKHATKATKNKQSLKFYLETTSPIVDAPSIGPKTASKLQKVGIRTVADLIEADPELLAEKLESARIDGETLVAWQHQAQLVCRIPGLRGHDAQVLVACGFTRPEEIASMKPAELFGFVEPFCQTDEGQRVLRNNRVPDLAEVSDWVAWSRHCRVLGAA